MSVPRRIMKKLETVKFPADQVEAAKAQFEDIVQYHMGKFSVTQDVDTQMRALALDCYIQGLIDGNQVAPVVQQMTGDLRVTELPGGGIVSTVVPPSTRKA